MARDRKPPFHLFTADFLASVQEAENETGAKEIRRKKEFIVVVSDAVRYALTTNNHIGVCK